MPITYLRNRAVYGFGHALDALSRSSARLSAAAPPRTRWDTGSLPVGHAVESADQSGLWLLRQARTHARTRARALTSLGCGCCARHARTHASTHARAHTHTQTHTHTHIPIRVVAAAPGGRPRRSGRDSTTRCRCVFPADGVSLGRASRAARFFGARGGAAVPVCDRRCNAGRRRHRHVGELASAPGRSRDTAVITVG